MTELDEWLDIDLPGWSSGVTTGLVTAHRTGQSALDSLGAALTRCTSDMAIIVIAGWSFNNVPTGVGYTNALLEKAAAAGTRIRCLFARPVVVQALGWTYVSDTSPDNSPNVSFINSLPHGAALQDYWVLHHEFSFPTPFDSVAPVLNPARSTIQVGIAHMKAWVVYDGARMTAWIGGVDINVNRTARQDPDYWHDVQAELGGPLADSVYRLLSARWNENPKMPEGTALPDLPRSAPILGKQRGRIITTFGNPNRWAGVGPSPSTKGYPFAPSGSTSYRTLVMHCIAKARRFIYIEDQYLVHEDIAAGLAKAMPSNKAIIILMPVTNGRVVTPPEVHPDGLKEVFGVSGELYQAWERRRRFLGHLAPYRDKVAVVTRDRYIHSKTWIFDDTVAVTGSANLNRRGYAHDTEGGVAFGDEGGSAEVASLRFGLWQLHLGPLSPAITLPAEQALALWQTPAPATKVKRYDPDAGRDTSPVPLHLPFGKDWFWDNLIDPDCP
jgi:phosphatidylserine/phosphatidylglycerophosphate/cardiolipin synthase-like enzyme